MRTATLATLALLTSIASSVHAQEVGFQQSLEDLVVLPKTWDISTARSLEKFSKEIVGEEQIALKLEANDLFVTAAQRAQSLEALTVPRDKFTELEGEVTQKFISARASSPSFLDTLSAGVQKLDVQTFAFNPTDLGGSSPATGIDSAFATLDRSQLTTLGRNKKIAGALLTANSAGFAIQLDELSLLPDQYKTSALSSFQQQYNKTLQSYKSAIFQPTVEMVKAFQTDAELTYDEFVQTWPELRRDPSARESAVRRLRSLNRQSSLKAIYGVKSVFEPKSYDAIFKQSQRVVGVGTSGDPSCSGVLYNSRWVLTAGHCLKNLGVSDIRVFADVPTSDDFEGERNVRLRVQDRWPSSGTGDDYRDPIDYALLHINESDLAGNDSLVQWLNNLQKTVPFCIRDEEANHRDPIVVIGRLRSEAAKVYDHAYVWFPFQVSSPQFNVLGSDTGFGLETFVQEYFRYKNDRIREFDKRYEQFEAAYKPTSASENREFRMTRQHASVDRPYFGFDTDTVSGNSGSPIYAREDNCLLGVFAGGVIDNAEFLNSSWARHEFGTPISAIIADLAKRGVGRGEVTSDIANAREILLKELAN